MAQFDVYLNPNRQSRERFPFLVDVQASVLDDLQTRLIVPLGYSSAFHQEPFRRLTPEVEYDGVKYILLVPQMSSVRSNLLKQPLGSIDHLRTEIIAAVDFAISGV